ncbi:MAG: TonB C-terminal domain-containing protein [Myxococcales bacterium]|nr:TonB C-terminal domain-containing protein [Myxococcales bacterium]
MRNGRKKKEAELQIKPPAPQPPPPPPQPLIDHRKQMVDQDKFPDEADNQDAHFLAQKNHRAEQETRAKNTNLVREVQSQQTAESEKSDNQQPDPGMNKEKLAELQNRDGAKNEVVRNAPMQGEEGKREAREPTPPGPLAMRDLTPKAAIDPVHEEKPREGLDKQEQGKGELPMARVGHDGQRAVAPAMGGKVNLNLNHHMYDQIEGAQAEAERREAAQAKRSHVAGRYDRYLKSAAAIRSSIENFTPAVRPGNQSELGTRQSPFAAYITAMHRQIHKLFTLGFLSDIELRGDSAYANEELWTQLEIVVKGDGSVERVGIVRSSGLLAFDVAAIDSVMSAAPFPAPPSTIKSANGKVYLDWQFHRDDRACGTFGVDPHILTTVAENGEHDTSETGAQAKAMERAARAQGASGASGAGGAANGASGAAGLGQPIAGAEGPRRLQREPTPRPRGDDDVPSAKPSAPTVVVPEVTSEVRAAAEGWFAAYARGDAAWLAGWSATPFTAAGEVVAKDAAALKAMYRQLLGESPQKRGVVGLEVLTPAGIRGKLGGLPPGGEPSEMLFAVGKAGGDEFILLLKKSSQGWRVCGIDR